MKRIIAEQRTAYLDKKKKPRKFKKKGNFNKEEIQSLVAQAVSEALEKPCKQPRGSDKASVKLQTKWKDSTTSNLAATRIPPPVTWRVTPLRRIRMNPQQALMNEEHTQEFHMRILITQLVIKFLPSNHSL